MFIAGDEGGDRVGGGSVEVVSGAVVAAGGAGVGVPGGVLGVAQRDWLRVGGLKIVAQNYGY